MTFTKKRAYKITRIFRWTTLYSSWIRGVKAITSLSSEITCRLQSYSPHRFSGVMQIVSIDAKGFGCGKKFCVGRTLKESEKKWDCNLKETEMRYWHSILEEYCNKLFSLIDSFWVENSGKHIDVYWLLKVRGHLDKVEKEQRRIKQKKLSTVSGNPNLKKMCFGPFNKHLPQFQYKADFLSYCTS